MICCRSVITLFGLLATLSIQAAAAAQPPMTLSRGDARTYLRAPESNFTGRAWIDPLFLQPQPPQRTTGSFVTFEPGARTAWHTHPLGQTLVVVSGAGWVQTWGEDKVAVQAGDVINFAPGVKHWHGATHQAGMVHLAIQEKTPEGNNVRWMEQVSDTQYEG